MNINDKKQIEIGGITFNCVFSNRAFNEYLKDTSSYDSQVNCFYVFCEKGAKVAGEEFKYSKDEFDDIVDTDPLFRMKLLKLLGEFFPEEGGDEKKQKKSSK